MARVRRVLPNVDPMQPPLVTYEDSPETPVEAPQEPVQAPEDAPAAAPLPDRVRAVVPLPFGGMRYDY